MDSKLARAPADRKASRKPRGRVSVLPPEPEADPEIPWLPLAPGELQRTLAGSDAEYGATVEAARRAAERAARAPVDPHEPIRVRALRLLAANLDELEVIAQSSVSSAAERTAALAQIARIADAYSADSPTALSAKPLHTLTYAELCQRVAEIDTRRAQLQARIAGEARPDPAGGGGT